MSEYRAGVLRVLHIGDATICVYEPRLFAMILTISYFTATEKAKLLAGLNALIVRSKFPRGDKGIDSFRCMFSVVARVAVSEHIANMKKLLEGLEALIDVMELTPFQQGVVKSAVHNPQDTLDEIQDTNLRCTGQSLIEKPLRRSKRLAAIQSAANRVHAI